MLQNDRKQSDQIIFVPIYMTDMNIHDIYIEECSIESRAIIKHLILLIHWMLYIQVKNN